MSQLPDIRIPKIPHIDKWIHMFVYGVFAYLLLVGGSIRRGDLRLHHYAFAIFLATGYGIGMEILQYFSKERSFEWMDMAANLLGALVGAVVFCVVFELLKRKPAASKDLNN